MYLPWVVAPSDFHAIDRQEAFEPFKPWIGMYDNELSTSEHRFSKQKAWRLDIKGPKVIYLPKFEVLGLPFRVVITPKGMI